MEEEPPPTPPFWLQSTTTRRQRFRPHFPSSSLFLSSGFLVSILCMSAIVFLVVVIPSLLSLTNQVFKPNSVRKSWDSVNLVLVLFAVVCGFLGRNKDYDDQRDRDLEGSFNVATPQSPSRSYQQYSNWYDYEYMVNRSRIHYEFGDQGNVTKLRRTSSSYPDLRQEIDWDVEYDHNPRYYDDSYAINAIRPPRSFKSVRSRREFDRDGEESSSDTRKVENVTTHIEKEPPPSLPPPPSIPGMYYSGESTRARNPPRKEHEPIGRRVKKTKIPPPSLPLPKARSLPPPPPPPAQPPLDRHNSDETRKKSGKIVTKDIPSSIYNQPKRKHKLIKTKSHEDLTDFWSLPPSPLPPTPPPPPPSKKLHNIFTSKKAKSGKKITLNSIPHPFAAKSTKFDPMEETSGDGYESPSIPIPPPPPPPPFKLPSWKFPVVHGDYVKITSNPKEADFDESEFEDGTDSDNNTPVAGNVTPATFCPSPDVNTKADDFIARFRATLKLEKLNSIKMEGKGVRLSMLGPDSSPVPSPHAMAMTGAI